MITEHDVARNSHALDWNFSISRSTSCWCLLLQIILYKHNQTQSRWSSEKYVCGSVRHFAVQILARKSECDWKTADISISRHIVNNYPMTKISRRGLVNRWKGRGFTETFPSNLRSERNKSVYFRSWGCYLLYNAIITRKKKKKKHSKNSTLSEKICYTSSYFVNSRSNYYACKILRYFLLLNQLRTGDIFTGYSYGCWVGL